MLAHYRLLPWFEARTYATNEAQARAVALRLTNSVDWHKLGLEAPTPPTPLPHACPPPTPTTTRLPGLVLVPMPCAPRFQLRHSNMANEAQGLRYLRPRLHPLARTMATNMKGRL